MMTIFNSDIIRKAICDSMPQNDHSVGHPDPKFTYVPPSHAKALNFEHTIVEGMRGAGKSHWWNLLSSQENMQYLEIAFPETGMSSKIKVKSGYGAFSHENSKWPSKDVLKALIKKGYHPRDIWKAIFATCADLKIPAAIKKAKWHEKLDWISSNPEDFDELLWSKDEECTKKDQKLLILFDALDRLADDWNEIRPLAKALFQLSLDMRSTKNIRFKIFVRPDMLEDSTILAFPDSSKLVARKVVLNWQRVDLYALFFQCIGNDKAGGKHFRDICKEIYDVSWKKSSAGGWVLPNDLKCDPELQKKIFHDIAGPAMAGGLHGRKRGFPYTWLPNHLIDGKEQVSPRSFSAALKHAAEHGGVSSWGYPLHYNGIKNGVQQASKIRVWEMTKEDYPWVADVMEPLSGLTVPCIDKEIFKLWKTAEVLEKMSSPTYLDGEAVKLLPPSLEDGNKGLLNDLLDLGIITFLWDGRVQMPDVYRISFKLGRKGGVKPLK